MTRLVRRRWRPVRFFLGRMMITSQKFVQVRHTNGLVQVPRDRTVRYGRFIAITLYLWNAQKNLAYNAPCVFRFLVRNYRFRSAIVLVFHRVARRFNSWGTPRWGARPRLNSCRGRKADVGARAGHTFRWHPFREKETALTFPSRHTLNVREQKKNPRTLPRPFRSLRPSRVLPWVRVVRHVTHSRDKMSPYSL